MAPMSFRGEPYVVDVVLRPLLSGLRWVVGVGLGGLLWWLDLVLWVPVPVIASTALLEGWLALRADRPIRIELERERLVIDDRFAATMTVFADRVRGLTIVHQPRVDAGRAGHEVVLVLASERRVLAAIALQVAELPTLPAGAVDVEAIDILLGARAGLLRAMAPATRICRQRVHDPALVDALARWVSDDARAHRALRLWSGAAPELSPFGLHVDDAGGVLLLGLDRWTFADDDGATRSGPRRCDRWHVAEREAVLFGVDGQEEVAEGVLPLLVLVLACDDGDGLAIAIPAPCRAEDRAPLPEGVHHTHAPEGAVLLAWLREAHALPRDLGPAGVQEGPHEPVPHNGDTPLPSPGDPIR